MSESTSKYQEYIDKPQALISIITEKDNEIEKLQRLLVNLQKMQFGRRSEKLTIVSNDQLPLLESAEVEPPQIKEPASINFLLT